jgi:FkbH-like protein
MQASQQWVLADALAKQDRWYEALDVYRAQASQWEIPPAAVCLRLARCCEQVGDVAAALKWALAVVDAGQDFTAWQSAWRVVERCRAGMVPRRAARVALLSSYTTPQFSPLLQLAARREHIELTVFEGDYAQYRQLILDPDSALYRFAPEFVILAVHAGELDLPLHSSDPKAAVGAELSRWTTLWQLVARYSSARVVQHTFALPAEEPMGHLAARLPGSRYRMIQALNSDLGVAAGDDVSMIDCERLAALVGTANWSDSRFWHLAKHAVAPVFQPLLAKHTAAVLAADLGLTRKCLVLDLDNTIWGGVVGEDGVANLRIGDGLEGEAFLAFQAYLLDLKARGVLLAVCSKNNDADAREPFERRAEMRLQLSDISCFVANWQAKTEQIQSIAQTLNLGLDSLVFVDDNPAERDLMRQHLPDVDVIALPDAPSGYVRAVSEYLLFESAAYTAEDARRTEQYRARALLEHAQANAPTLEEFHRTLGMRATIVPFNEVDLPRIAQLIGKSNQFNVTSRRHGLAQLRAFMRDEDCVHLSLRLEDRFTNHGLVSVLIAVKSGDVMDIDTWLMSCRVIGRTVEDELLHQLIRRAQMAGCSRIRGVYIPSPKNAMVADLFSRLGFYGVTCDGTTEWLYDVPLDARDWDGVIEVANEPA